MAKNFVKPADHLPLVCPYATVASGQGMLVGIIFGVALYDAVTGGTVEVATEGEWVITALSTDVVTAGAAAYWDNTNRRITSTSTGNTLVGAFTKAKANAETTAQIKLLAALGAAASPDIAATTVVTVSSAELLALNATPKTLVAAPGAGIANVPEFLELFYDYGTAAYAGIAAGEDFTVKYTNGSGAVLGTIDATGFIDQTTNQSRFLRFSSEITPVANAALVLHMASGEVITGDGIVKAKLHYRPITLLAP